MLINTFVLLVEECHENNESFRCLYIPTSNSLYLSFAIGMHVFLNCVSNTQVEWYVSEHVVDGKYLD